jgi:hypothetical protein
MSLPMSGQGAARSRRFEELSPAQKDRPERGRRLRPIFGVERAGIRGFRPTRVSRRPETRSACSLVEATGHRWPAPRQTGPGCSRDSGGTS